MNRVERIKVPRKLPPYLSDETINKLIVAADHSRSPLRDRAIVLTLMDTGIRAGELVGLKMRDLDLEGGVIKVFGKDQEERVVPINLQACKALTLYLSERSRHDDAPVFTSQQTGDALTTSGLLSILRRLARRAGVEERVYTHLFRHTFAHRWVTGGGDLESLRQTLGHSRLDTTQIYAGLRVEDIKQIHRKVSPADRLLRAAQLSLW